MAFFNPNRIDFNPNSGIIESAGAIGKSLWDFYKDAKVLRQNQAKIDENITHNRNTEAETYRNNLANNYFKGYETDAKVRNYNSQIDDRTTDNKREDDKFAWQKDKDIRDYSLEQAYKSGLLDNMAFDNNLNLEKHNFNVSKFKAEQQEKQVQKQRDDAYLVKSLLGNDDAINALGFDKNKLIDDINQGKVIQIADEIRAKTDFNKMAKNSLGLDVGVKRKNYTSSTMNTIINAQSYFDDRLRAETINGKDAGEYTGGMSTLKKGWHGLGATLFGNENSKDWLKDKIAYDNASNIAAQKSSNLFLNGKSTLEEREKARSQVSGYKTDWLDTTTQGKGANDFRVLDQIQQTIQQEEANGKDAQTLKQELNSVAGKMAAILQLKGVKEDEIIHQLSGYINDVDIFNDAWEKANKSKELINKIGKNGGKLLDGSEVKMRGTNNNQNVDNNETITNENTTKNFIDTQALGITFRF